MESQKYLHVKLLQKKKNPALPKAFGKDSKQFNAN